jgi:hypothetical protein
MMMIRGGCTLPQSLTIDQAPLTDITIVSGFEDPTLDLYYDVELSSDRIQFTPTRTTN